MNHETTKALGAEVDKIEAALDEIRSVVGHRDADVLALARGFTSLNDDQQAKFFVEVARIMAGWGAGKAEMQAHYIGRHLSTCECSTDDARELVRNVAAATEERP